MVVLYICKYCYHKPKEGFEKQRFLEITAFFGFEVVLLHLFFNIIRNVTFQCTRILLLLERTLQNFGLSPAKDISANYFCER